MGEHANLHRRCVKLPAAPSEMRWHQRNFNEEEANSAVQIYFQCGRVGIEEHALVQLLALAMQNPCFEELRTKQQLGYIVFSGSMLSLHVRGFRFIVQSDNTAPAEVYERCMSFMESFRATNLAEMTEEDFETVRAGLIAKQLQKDQNLY